MDNSNALDYLIHCFLTHKESDSYSCIVRYSTNNKSPEIREIENFRLKQLKVKAISRMVYAILILVALFI